MSCETGKRRVSIAAAKCGVGRLASGTAYALGTMQQGVARASEKAGEMTYALNRSTAPASNAMLAGVNHIEREGLNQIAAMGVRVGVDVLAGGAYTRLAATRQVVDEVSAKAGTAVGDLSRDELKNVTVENAPYLRFFRKRTGLQAWTSHLTPLVNAGTRASVKLQAGGGRVTHSSGLIIRVDGKTWHSGLVKAKTRGGNRTVQRVTSLSLPPQDYYFDRELKSKELAQLVARRRPPASIDGYIGQVSSMDNLAGSWGRMKHNLIRQRILFPPPGSEPGARSRAGRVLARIPNEKDVKRTAKATRNAFDEVTERLNTEAATGVFVRAAEKAVEAKIRNVILTKVLPTIAKVKRVV